MVCKDFRGLKVSSLGFGTMRLPVVGGNSSAIDMDAVKKMVNMAIAGGVNYFDTAWGYHGGNSELAMGEALKPFERGAYFLADKFPGYDLSNFGKVEEIFNQQLKKCQTDYFDFYLFHNVSERSIEHYLDDKKWGTYSYLIKMRDTGKIRHLGFSCHGDLEVLERFLNAYGKDIEFCQLQTNWIDWHFQKCAEKLALLNSWNIPLWVMEPLRGGKLASLSAKNEAALKAMRPDESVPAWSFRFIQSIPEAVVTLSGMSNEAQLAENIGIFSKSKPLNAEEREALIAIGDAMVKNTALPCTACNYCVPHCPKDLDIPRILSLYNEHVFTGGGFLAGMVLSSFKKERLPSKCIACNHCIEVCPQSINIPAAMKDFAKKVPM